ncbi:hypothetical protein NQ317_017374 [Molorchus minor]|uniref:RRM domain-containing protein n=1 Tax=Molorchus minor TaxID=1323400 RepID=A0ABQ9JCL5_9CUCU|nr:hypothetical protein NQ317_017374 [Molorchus minor]
MNRMNLPPPFVVENPIRTITPSLHPVLQKPVEQQVVIPEPPKPPESSSESELETDEEDFFLNRQYIPQKRKSTQKKVIKRPKFIKPPVVQASSIAKTVEKPENVFEKVDIQIQKKIEVKVPSDTLEQQKQVAPEKIGSFGILLPLVKPEAPKDNPPVEEKPLSEERPVITVEELAANRIAHKDLGVLPVFKNYHPGSATCRLYIKNIAKTVVVKDLEYIYHRYKVPEGGTPSQFDIRLMQEGRMKGQAFVTLDNVELAQKALKETNGYILKDKPLVVVFARSAVQKK